MLRGYSGALLHYKYPLPKYIPRSGSKKELSCDQYIDTAPNTSAIMHTTVIKYGLVKGQNTIAASLFIHPYPYALTAYSKQYGYFYHTFRYNYTTKLK